MSTIYTKRYKLKRNERHVSAEGHAMVKAYCEAGKPIYNGITHTLLREKYGDVLRHVMGYGWVVTNKQM